MEIFKKKICLSELKSRESSNWGILTGYTSNGNIEYLTNIGTGITANLATLNIFISQTFDDLGVLNSITETWSKNKTYYEGETVIYDNNSYRCKTITSNSPVFNLDNWESNLGETLVDNFGNKILTDNREIIRTDEIGIQKTVIFNGESKIDEFRRYSKKPEDIDLYNPLWNSGFTQEIANTYGNINKIIAANSNTNGERQNLYEYIIGATIGELETTGIHFKDIGGNISQISYLTNNNDQENLITVPAIKLDYLLGNIQPPKVVSNVLIDRGSNSTYDKNLKLGEIRSLEFMENYGNGFFKIKNN